MRIAFSKQIKKKKKMSLTEVRIKGTKMRIPLGSLLHKLLHESGTTNNKSIENQGDTPIYHALHIAKPYTKSLGKGSTGTVYHATFALSHHTIDCVVKFPNTLLRDECIVISKDDGAVTLNPQKKDEHKEDRRQALEELEIEWHNAFVLRYGKAMAETRIAEPYHASVSVESLRKAAHAVSRLEHEWGYGNIHQLLAMDASVPCLLSEHLDMTVLEWARKTRPTQAQVARQAGSAMLAALHYMHTCALMAHMDVKPNNMLYSQQHRGRGHAMVLSDFGASMPSDTLSHEPAGTVGYIAPEVVAGAQYMPKYADAFSLGVSMLHLMHPEIPCDTSQDQSLMLDRIMGAHGDDDNSMWLQMVKAKTPAERYTRLERLFFMARDGETKGLWIQQAS